MMITIIIVLIVFLVCQLLICFYAKENFNVQQITGHFGGVPSQANIDPCQTVGYGYANKGCVSFDNKLPQSKKQSNESYSEKYMGNRKHSGLYKEMMKHEPYSEPYMEMMKHEPYSEKYMEMMKHKPHSEPVYGNDET